MIAVIFEVWPRDGERGRYLNIAAELRPQLEQVDGFLSVERFESLTEPGKLLSLSFWRDEEAVKRWRCAADHRHAQGCGRAEIFNDYRLRIAGVIRDYGMFDRAQAPDPEVAPAPPRQARTPSAAKRQATAEKGPLHRLALQLGARLRRLYLAYWAEEHLAELDEHLLRDIGLARSDIRGAVRGRRADPSGRSRPQERTALRWRWSGYRQIEPQFALSDPAFRL